MTKNERGLDLPGDESFRPATGGVVDIGGRLAMLQSVSPQEQADQHHNLLRYNELRRLRQGLPNLYNETRYRHGPR